MTSQPVQAEEDVNLEKALRVFTGEGRSPTTGIGSINPSCKCNVCYIEPERCSFHTVTCLLCNIGINFNSLLLPKVWGKVCIKRTPVIPRKLLLKIQPIALILF